VANDAHLKELKLGSTHWNAWRKLHFAEQPDLSGADLSGLDLSGANLIGANLHKAALNLANLSGAYLSCANLSLAYLSETNLTKANLSKANLTKADLSFTDLTAATLIEADLNRATLIEATLVMANLSFADLNRANLSKANLQDANLSRSILIEANLTHANLRACNLNQAIASEANLREANLIEARLNKADFSFANCIEANFRRANLTKVIFIEANLRGANLRETILRNSSLGRANLGNADFTEANATESNFMGVDLIRANLSKATLVQANFSEAKLSGANLSRAIAAGANFCEADLSETDLTKTDLRQANLTQADLTRSRIAATNFNGAALTGICLEDAQLSSTAKLEGITCDFFYLKRNAQDRRPNEGDLLPGEFAQIFHSALETLNLTLHSGVNWTAFAHSVNRLNVLYKAAHLGIQSIENKGDGIILLKLSTAPGMDTVQIHRDFMAIYEETKRALENRRQLNTKDTLLGHGPDNSSTPRESINQLFELLNPNPNAESNGRSPSEYARDFKSKRPESLTATNADAATLIRVIMDDLAQRYPDATEAQKILVSALEIQQTAKRDAAFKIKLTEALQSGSLLIGQVFQNNAFTSIPIDIAREWFGVSAIAVSPSTPTVASVAQVYSVR
jgi:uncharacterized protein YjbI with pentapeptide repeats